ncbi:hypothetical protein [Marinicrinis lubricantis]|uniref:Uncharacterized protein n=1 Tax=Marinicrinis lubricantis TaxID=2086470 RepID=A0ABW1IKJ1_9BACL
MNPSVNIAAIYGSIDEADRIEAGELGISMDSLPLQKFFSYLIEGGEQVE